MSRFLKILLAIVALVLAVIVIAPFFISQDVYKQQIVQAFERSTGRTLEINGDISLQFRPTLEFVANDVTLSNAEGAAGDYMAKMDVLTLGLDWSALFGREISITKLILERPSLSLEVLPDGTANWEFEAVNGEESDAGPEEAAAAATDQIGAISFGDLRLIDGALSYRNGLTGETYEVSSIDAQVDLPDLTGPFRVTGDLVYQGEEMDIDLSLGSLAAIPRAEQTPIALKLKSSLVTAELDGTFTGGKDTLIKADAKVEVPSVRKFAAWNGTPVEMKKGFGPFSADGKLRIQGNQYAFEEANLAFDEMKGNGALTVNTGGSKPVLNGRLNVDTVDFRKYMEVVEEVAAASEKTSSGWSEEVVDLSALKNLDANFTIKSDALYFQDYEIGAADLLIRVKNSKLTAALNNLSLYSGSAKGTLSFDASRPATKIGASFAFTGISAGPLLKAATSKDLIEGMGDLGFSVETSGRSQKDWMKGLAGKGGLTLRDGKIIGADLNRMLQIAAALTPTEAVAPAGEEQTTEQAGLGKSTDFVEMGGSFKVVDGVLKTKDILLVNEVLSLTGSGRIDLGRQKVDLRLVPGQNQQDGGTRVAMKVQGDWDNIKYVPDFETVLKDKLRDALIGGKDDEDSDEPSDTEQVINILESIFGGKDQ